MSIGVVYSSGTHTSVQVMSWLPLDRSPPLFQLPMTCTFEDENKASRSTGAPLASTRGAPFSCSMHTRTVMVLYLLKLARFQRPLMRQPSPSRVMVPVGWPLPLKAYILTNGIKRRIGSTAACPADREATDEIRALQATAPSSLAKASIVWMSSRGAVSGPPSAC